MQVPCFADVVFYIRTVIGHRAVDVGAAAHEVAQFSAEAVTDRAHLAVAFGHVFQVHPRVLHVAHAEVVVEIIVEIERLLHVFGVPVVQLDARFLAPEEVGHEAHESGLGEFLRVAAHGVVHAPYFHDGDDCAGGGAFGGGGGHTHLTVPQADGGVPGPPHPPRCSAGRPVP